MVSVCWAWRLSVVIVEQPGPVMSGAEGVIGGMEDSSNECGQCGQCLEIKITC